MSPLDVLRDVVATPLLERCERVSRTLTALGVPHALIGGLAVGVHGRPRATKDVDFLVGREAFSSTSPLLVYREELRALVGAGAIDLLDVPPGRASLAGELRLAPDVPVISLPGLVVMKLDANRPQDRDDVRVLLARHPESLRALRDHLAEHAPDLLPRFAEVLAPPI